MRLYDVWGVGGTYPVIRTDLRLSSAFAIVPGIAEKISNKYLG